MEEQNRKRAENFTEREKNAIKTLRKNGMTYVQISKIFNVSESAARMVCNRQNIVQGLPPKENLSRRAVTPLIRILLLNAIKETPSISLRSLHAVLKKNLNFGQIPCICTVRQYVNQKKIIQKRMKKKPLISITNQEKRVLFARKMLQKELGFECDDIVFSDETTVRQFNCRLNQTYWRLNDETFIEPTVPNVHSGGQSVMFWSCMSSAGFGPIVPINGTMNADKYCELLEHVVSPYLKTLEESGRRVVFQQDNAPCHSAKKVQEKLRQLNICSFKWATVSPDLNPIENAWATLKHRRQKRYGFPKNKEQIIEQITTIWNSFPVEEAQKLCGSFINRINEVVEKKGLPINY